PIPQRYIIYILQHTLVHLYSISKYVNSLSMYLKSTILNQSANHNPKSPIHGELILSPVASRSIPPATIHGARGWMSCYVVPVLSGTFSGRLTIDGKEIVVDGVSGYHDHNWGYWQGVSWQWGQVSNGDVSIVYGRVLP